MVTVNIPSKFEEMANNPSHSIKEWQFLTRPTSPTQTRTGVKGADSKQTGSAWPRVVCCPGARAGLRPVLDG